MTYEIFKETLLSELQNHFPPDTTVSIQSVSRNNHVTMDGLTILQAGFNIAPTIYIQKYYDALCNGTSFSRIFQQILNTYHNFRPTENIDPSFFCDFQKIQKYLVYKLIHFDRNRELLQEIPYIPFLDLAIVFYCLLSADETSTATILVRNEHLNLWHTDLDSVYRIARENTPFLLPHRFESMWSVLTSCPEFSWELSHLTRASSTDSLDDSSEIPMYVLTNQNRFLGASCILYEELLQDLSNCFESDFYVIPSSIHETILIPSNAELSVDELNSMIQEVNTVQLIPEEILSDHVYFYNQKKAQLQM